MNFLVIWLKQIRANFLILAILLVLIGVSLAYRYMHAGHSLHLINIVLLITGVILAHVSVNLFNEYSDFRTGASRVTGHALFHSEKSMLASGYTKPSSVLAVAVITLLAATFIGIYFTLTAHWSLMILILIGGFAIVTYTDLLTHKLLGELFSGLTFGSLVVVGCYIALTASPMDRLSQLVQPAVWLVALPPGLLTSLLLLLNQFSEGKENVSGLSKHKMARFTRKQTIRLYLTGSVLSLLIIAYLSFSGIGSLWMLLALIPLSVTFMSVKTVCLYGGNAENLISVLKRNILSVLLTDAFLAIAIFLSV